MMDHDLVVDLEHFYDLPIHLTVRCRTCGVDVVSAEQEYRESPVPWSVLEAAVAAHVGPSRRPCPECSTPIRVNADGRLREHDPGTDSARSRSHPGTGPRCTGSGTAVGAALVDGLARVL